MATLVSQKPSRSRSIKKKSLRVATEADDGASGCQVGLAGSNLYALGRGEGSQGPFRQERSL